VYFSHLPFLWLPCFCFIIRCCCKSTVVLFFRLFYNFTENFTVFSITCFCDFGSWLFLLKVCIPILYLQDLSFSQQYLLGFSSMGYNTVPLGAWFPLFWSNVEPLEYGNHSPNTAPSPRRPQSCFYFLCNPVILSVGCTFIVLGR